MLGSLHALGEPLDRRLGDAGPDRPAFGTIRRIVYVMPVRLEVTHVVDRHPSLMFRPVRFTGRTQAVDVCLQNRDHLIHVAVPQIVLQLFRRNQCLGGILAQRRSQRLVQMLHCVVVHRHI